jgi:hypothetical protein
METTTDDETKTTATVKRADGKLADGNRVRVKNKNIDTLRNHVLHEIGKKGEVFKNGNGRETNNILELVRGLSNQEDDISGSPELTFVLKKLVKFAEERWATHAASQKYFDKLNASFFWPSIGLTSLTSITGFVASYSSAITAELNLAMGIMASFSTLIVALSETYRYGSKAEQHGLASESYENLRTKLFFKSVQLQTAAMRKSKDGEDFVGMTQCEFKTFFTSIEDQIMEIARQCKNLVPHTIVNEYKETRFDYMVETLARDLQTVIAQDKFARIVDKLSKGKHLTVDDQKEIEKIEKAAKSSKKKRTIDSIV